MNKIKKKLSLIALISSISFLNFAEPVNAMKGDEQIDLEQADDNSAVAMVFNNLDLVEYIARFMDNESLKRMSRINKDYAYIAFAESNKRIDPYNFGSEERKWKTKLAKIETIAKCIFLNKLIDAKKFFTVERVPNTSFFSCLTNLYKNPIIKIILTDSEQQGSLNEAFKDLNNSLNCFRSAKADYPHIILDLSSVGSLKIFELYSLTEKIKEKDSSFKKCIKQLILDNNDLSEIKSEYLQPLLLIPNVSLKRTNFNCQELERSFKNNTVLKELNIEENTINERNLKELQKNLTRNNTLKKLSIHKKLILHIDNESTLKELQNILKGNNTFEKLILHIDNKSTFKELQNILKGNNTLKKRSLHVNVDFSISQEEKNEIALFFKNNTVLKELSIEQNSREFRELEQIIRSWEELINDNPDLLNEQEEKIYDNLLEQRSIAKKQLKIRF